jgi:hypothetical protein
MAPGEPRRDTSGLNISNYAPTDHAFLPSEEETVLLSVAVDRLS